LAEITRKILKQPLLRDYCYLLISLSIGGKTGEVDLEELTLQKMCVWRIEGDVHGIWKSFMYDIDVSNLSGRIVRTA
jgi:hypothetical protein